MPGGGIRQVKHSASEGNRNHLGNVTPTRKPDDSKPFVSFVLTERSQTPGTTQNAV